MTLPPGEPAPSGIIAATTRDRLILAAIDALRQLTVTRIISAVGTREIARRAGVSPASLFHHFATVEALADEVISTVFDPSLVPIGPLLDELGTLSRTRLPLETASILHSVEFDRLVADDMLRVRTGLWALGGTDLDAHYAHYVDTVDAQVVPGAVQLFDSWGTQLRPPWEVRTFLKTQSALLSGSVIRHLSGPGPDDRTNFVNAAVTLSLTSLRTKGFSHDIADRLRELNHHPIRVEITPDGDDSTGSSRTRVLEAAADQFLKRGYEHSTIGQVARAASVSESTVYGQFESKRALAAELFRAQTRTLADQRGAEVDRRPDAEPHPASMARMRDFATIIAESAYIAKEIAPAYLTDLADATSRADWIVEHLAELIAHVDRCDVPTSPDRSGATDPESDDSVPPPPSSVEPTPLDHRSTWASHELARVMVIAITRRVLVLPDESASDSAGRVLAMFGTGR